MVEQVQAQPDDIKKLLSQAGERIESARVLTDKGYFRDAISRAYYAFFDAASAALLSEGFVAKTHKGLGIVFEQHFIKSEKVSVGVGRWLAKAEQAREEADYELHKEFTKEQAEAAVRAAEEFVKTIRDLIL
jgi:uncharacterized protein